MLVTNDVAERYVSLGERYNKKITKDEEEFQKVLVGVQFNRSAIKTSKKRDICEFLKNCHL